jgi:hypothetical protein
MGRVIEMTMQSPTNGATGRLQRFQDGFARALLAPDADADCAAEVADLVRQPGFSVYRNTVTKGCIDALQANYPCVARLVGDEWFRAAAAIYARANLPRHPSLLDYAEGFPQFLAGFDPAAELPYLPGVARLDRFWTEAHAARDEAPVDAADVARLAPEQLARTVLRPHTSARWGWFAEHPVFTIWERNRAFGDYRDTPDIPWRAEGALVVRPYGAVAWIRLDAAGCAFLDTCAAGGTLAAAAASAVAADAGTDLTELMAQLLHAGAFGHLILLDHDRQEESQ